MKETHIYLELLKANSILSPYMLLHFKYVDDFELLYINEG